MNTLIALAILSVLVLVMEIINLRKIIVPVTIIGLLATLGISVSEWDTNQSFYHSMIVVNKTNMLFSGLFIVLTIFLVALSESFYKPIYNKIADFVSIKLFLLIGAICMTCFGNMVMFFLGLEILSISLYVLAGSDFTNIKSNEAGMKYLLLGSFASGFVLFGIAMIYGATASFNITNIHELWAQQPTWFSFGAVLVLIGLLFKVAAFPFHFWAPDVYQGSPILTTALMSTLAKVAAVAALFKLYLIFTPGLPTAFNSMLVFIIMATMLVGNIMALQQNNVKRMLAYSGISHAGFMLMTLLSAETATPYLFYYAAAYSIAGIAAFSAVLYVCQGMDDEDISSFKGLVYRKPLMAIVLAGGLLSMAGIPVMAGFFGKLFLFENTLNAGYTFLVIWAVINSIISIYYYFRLMITAFSKPETEITNNNKKHYTMYMLIGMISVIISIAIGIYPDLILGLF
ncbi:MAG TPA: NADH-quinone oxidoreductase subunit N [Flavobacterium sp.]|nr:NADH-quinone oxidoreductase subunit N [Flavobacterium sp.]